MVNGLMNVSGQPAGDPYGYDCTPSFMQGEMSQPLQQQSNLGPSGFPMEMEALMSPGFGSGDPGDLFDEAMS